MDLTRLDPVVAWLEAHWPRFDGAPTTARWFDGAVQTLAVIIMATLCAIVMMGVLVYAALWMFLSAASWPARR